MVSWCSRIVPGFVIAVIAPAFAQTDPPAQADNKSSVIKLAFDDLPVDSLPAGWKIEGTLATGEPAVWKIVADESAPSSPNVLALTESKHGSSSTFNLCWNDQIRFRDGDIEVRFKPTGGKEDQG